MSKKILVIDDDVDLNYSVTELLKDLGYAVDSITDPRGIGQALGNGGYETVLLDLKMPSVSGTDFIPVIKEKLPRTRLVVMSGRPSIPEFLAQKGLSRYVDGILDKPFGVSDLLQQIELPVE